MKSQKILLSLITVLTISLVIVLSSYYLENTKTEKKEEVREIVTIMAIYDNEQNNKLLEKMLSEYSAAEGNPIVEISFVSQANFQKELCIRKDQNKLPDLIIMENVMTSALQSMGILSETTDYMTSEKIAEYTQNAYNSTLVNGVSYAVPFDSDPLVLFYNQDYFDSYGEKIPEKLSDFYKIKRLGTYHLGLAVKDKEDISSIFYYLVVSSGGSIRNLQSEHCTELYHMLELLRENEILAPDTVNWNQNDLMESFANGYVKVAIARLSALSVLETKDTKFTVRIAEIPVEQRKVYLLEGQNIGITTTADDKSTMKVMQYLLRKENIQRYCEQTNHLSVRWDLNVNPAESYGLTQDYITKEREQSLLKSTYSTWFLISDAISEDMTAFLSERTMPYPEFQDKIQEDVRNAILER